MFKGMKSSSNDFIMSQGKKVGNLKGRAVAHKPVHKTAKPQAGPERKQAGTPFHKKNALPAPLQSATGTTYSPVGNAMAKGPYKDRHQSLGKVNSGFVVNK